MTRDQAMQRSFLRSWREIHEDIARLIAEANRRIPARDREYLDG